MIHPNGFWGQDLHDTGHCFSLALADFIFNEVAGTDCVVHDMGCGLGAYVMYLNKLGVESVGYEGVKPQNAYTGCIYECDITEPIHLTSYSAGHVICLEVAEHIPSRLTSGLIENIKRLCIVGGKLFLSWAVHGQAGDGHVNCRDNLYVLKLLSANGFEVDMVASMRGRNSAESNVAWFRNTFFVFNRVR